VFIDDFGRGTMLLVDGTSATFSGPGVEVSGVRVIRTRRSGVQMATVRSSKNGIFISGRGSCPNGPGSFSASSFFRIPAIRLQLRDVTP
jgi:hypothetical protein